MHQNVQYQPRICYIIQPKSFWSFYKLESWFFFVEIGKVSFANTSDVLQ